MLDANWTLLPATNGNGVLGILADPGAAGRRGFYRAQVLLVP